MARGGKGGPTIRTKSTKTAVERERIRGEHRRGEHDETPNPRCSACYSAGRFPRQS